MQTLYRVRCTDRITVKTFAQHDEITYVAYYDGVEVARGSTGEAAVTRVVWWLQARQKQRELDALAAAERIRHVDEDYDNTVLVPRLTEALGLDDADFRDLIGLIARRIARGEV